MRKSKESRYGDVIQSKLNRLPARFRALIQINALASHCAYISPSSRKVRTYGTCAHSIAPLGRHDGHWADTIENLSRIGLLIAGTTRAI